MAVDFKAYTAEELAKMFKLEERTVNRALAKEGVRVAGVDKRENTKGRDPRVFLFQDAEPVLLAAAERAARLGMAKASRRQPEPVVEESDTSESMAAILRDALRRITALERHVFDLNARVQR